MTSVVRSHFWSPPMRCLLTCRLLAVALPIAMSSILASPARPSDQDTPAPYRAKRMFRGCWEMTTHHPERSRWPKSSVRWCFDAGRMISGVASDAGDAWNFCEYWRVDGNRLSVRDDYGNSQRCLYAFKEGGQTLVLRDCPSAGDWHREAKPIEPETRTWTCRMQTYSGPEE